MRFLRRLAFHLVAAWVSLTLAFLVPRLAPGDPASAVLGRLQGQLPPEALAALKRTYGLVEAPLWQQYGVYLSHVLRGDLGISIKFFPAPVSSVIWSAMGWTLLLTGTSVLVSFAVGSALGAVAATRRGGWLDRRLPPLLVLVGAFPYFWLAMTSVYLLGFVLGWFPLHHAYSFELEPEWSVAFVADVLYHLVLPASCIVVATLGGWMLSMRSSMSATLGEDYVRFAHARGLHPLRVAVFYGARNALLPNLAGFGMALGFVVSGSLLTEVVFAYPGQGQLLWEAVQAQDYPLIQGLFLAMTLTVLLANAAVDLVSAWLDPRAQSGADD